MKVTLQVERHVVMIETDYKAADSQKLFNVLIAEAVKKMDFILCKEKGAEK